MPDTTPHMYCDIVPLLKKYLICMSSADMTKVNLITLQRAIWRCGRGAMTKYMPQTANKTGWAGRSAQRAASFLFALQTPSSPPTPRTPLLPPWPS